MVQVLFDPTQPQAGHMARDDVQMKTSQSQSREEHAQLMRDLATKRKIRAPRRGWSMTEGGDANYTSGERRHIVHESSLPSVSENSSSGTSTPISEKSYEDALVQVPLPTQLPVRPKMPPPRRSYSVQDYEPLPPMQPKPSTRMSVLDLPSEIHYALFDFLDPLDGVCLGLAHSRLHDIAKRKYGKQVSLASRYSGPNDMEWAWRGAGPLVRSNSGGMAARGIDEGLRPKGQVYCRKCGISRCELHRHLKEWMGEDREYCEIKRVFGRPAGEEAKAYCYMSSPKNPNRCGRHGPKRT